MRHLDYSNVGCAMLRVSFYCKIRKKDNPTAQIRADGSNVMADLCRSRCVCDTIRSASHQVDHSTGLHAELLSSWAFDMEAAPIFTGWSRSRTEKLPQRLKEKKQAEMGILLCKVLYTSWYPSDRFRK